MLIKSTFPHFQIKLKSLNEIKPSLNEIKPSLNEIKPSLNEIKNEFKFFI